MSLTTGIVIFAPREVQAVAVPIMRQIAPESRICIPAHITLMFPFVAHERLDAASQITKSICTNIAPFEITLAGFGHFMRLRNAASPFLIPNANTLAIIYTNGLPKTNSNEVK